MKPVLYIIPAFDASKKYIFKFAYNGNQSFGNICIIKDNQTNNIVYSQSQTTMKLEHELEANTLQNGKAYNISIETIDENGQVSGYSNPVVFFCYTTPTFEFTNLSENQVIKNASYQVNMRYYQPEGELLQSHEISLYDQSKNIIQTSNVQFDVSNISYLLTSLEEDYSYYIRATGYTIEGMSIDTGYINFNVNYIKPTIYSIISLENIEQNGYIKIQSNVTSVDCNTFNDPIFINSDYVDLRNDVLKMDDDFSLENDFVINLSGYNILDGLIMQLFGDRGNITLYKRKGKFGVNNGVEKTYIELNASVGNVGYVCFSNHINNPSDTQVISIWLTKKNGSFSIDLKVGE